MGLGGAGSAAAVFVLFAIIDGLTVACVGWYASTDARSTHIINGWIPDRSLRWLSAIGLPLLLIIIWVTALNLLAPFGIGFGAWLGVPLVFAGSIWAAQRAAHWLRSIEFSAPGPIAPPQPPPPSPPLH